MTIGITVFNEGDLLAESWDSVINQTSQNWEVIMVLDGGGDQNTRQLFSSINHSRLRKYSFDSNQGPYPCRTKAIEMTDTEWYFHLDADDMLPPEAVELVLNKINQNPDVEFIAGACKHFGLGLSQIVPPSNDDEVLCICPLFFPQAPIKKSLFKKIGGYYIPDYVFHSDWDFWFSVYEKQIKGAEVDGVIYKRRRRHKNITNLGFQEFAKSTVNIIELHPKFFNSKKRKRRALYNVCEKLARHYRNIGNRFKAKKYAVLANTYGLSTPTLKEIFIEADMSNIRYGIRRLARRIYKISDIFINEYK